MRKQQPSYTEIDEQTKQQLLEFVGPNNDYFEKKWTKTSRRKNILSINISALFLGLFYLAYRKMFLYAYGTWGILILIDVLRILTFKQITPSTSYTSATIVLGFVGNDLYYRFALKKVNKNKPQSDISKSGGTSWGHAILFFLVVTASSLALSVLEEKVYYDYAIPRFEKAVSLQEEGERERAMNIYNEIENKQFPLVNLYFNRALILANQKEYKKALENIETYLSYASDDEKGLDIQKELKKKLELQDN